MIVYLYSKCSTCQKALRFLEARLVPVTIKEITKEPPSIAELQRMLQFCHGNIKKLLNTSGILYREMQLSQKLASMPISDVLALLSTQGMLVKRPFLLADDFGFAGFNEAEWAKKL